MGVYNIFIGKGIVMSPKMLFQRYAKEMNKKIQEGETIGLDAIREMIVEEFGEVDVSSFGHDAFTSRYTERGKMHIPEIFDDSDHREILESIMPDKGWKGPDGFEVYYYVFIGTEIELRSQNGGEFEWRLEAPELLYGLTLLVQAIIKASAVLSQIDSSKFETIQKPLIWTYAQDCCCCT